VALLRLPCAGPSELTRQLVCVGLHRQGKCCALMLAGCVCLWLVLRHRVLCLLCDPLRCTVHLGACLPEPYTNSGSEAYTGHAAHTDCPAHHSSMQWHVSTSPLTLHLQWVVWCAGLLQIWAVHPRAALGHAWRFDRQYCCWISLHVRMHAA
jgi:hypothetical protein